MHEKLNEERCQCQEIDHHQRRAGMAQPGCCIAEAAIARIGRSAPDLGSIFHRKHCHAERVELIERASPALMDRGHRTGHRSRHIEQDQANDREIEEPDARSFRRPRSRNSKVLEPDVVDFRLIGHGMLDSAGCCMGKLNSP